MRAFKLFEEAGYKKEIIRKDINFYLFKKRKTKNGDIYIKVCPTRYGDGKYLTHKTRSQVVPLDFTPKEHKAVARLLRELRGVAK